MKSKKRIAIILVALAVALLGAMLLATAFGAVHISPGDILKMSWNKLPFAHLDPSWSGTDEAIIFQLRLPGVVGAAVVGSALATAGALFQGLLRNPLADPYLIGTSSGALFAIVLALIFLPAAVSFSGFGIIPFAAFLGALGAVFLVYTLARIGGGTRVVTLILVGSSSSSDSSKSALASIIAAPFTAFLPEVSPSPKGEPYHWQLRCTVAQYCPSC